jgi:hypothetical protein
MIIVIVFAWLLLGVLTAGGFYSYLQYDSPGLEPECERRGDLGWSLLIGLLFAPVSFIVVFFVTGFFQYGFFRSYVEKGA